MSDNANQWNRDEMLAEARARVRDQGGELVSRQALAVLEVCAEQLQALWSEANRQHERLCALEEATAKANKLDAALAALDRIGEGGEP